MKKEFTPYEQALALKELGFDEPCFTWYWDDIGLYNGLEYGNHNKREHVVSAPTFSQAFGWFREKYNLGAIVSQFGYAIENQYGQATKFEDDRNHLSYEELELECLKKLIKLIKKGNK
jgi:hypothetical protein